MDIGGLRFHWLAHLAGNNSFICHALYPGPVKYHPMVDEIEMERSVEIRRTAAGSLVHHRCRQCLAYRNALGDLEVDRMNELIAKKFAEKCKTPSDIYQHLPTLSRYAGECSRITELERKSD
jgi:hypothetical protein